MKAAWLAFALMLTPAAQAVDGFKGFVRIKSGHELYTEYTAAREGKPTVVLVNGLVYDMDRWNRYAERLTKEGVGVVKYYFRGQLETLVREVETAKTPEFFAEGLTPRILADELRELLNALDLKSKVDVVGLSYGSVIAAEFAQAFPKRVDNLILMAPLVVSLDHYDPVGAWIRMNLAAVRLLWGPLWGPVAYDYYYDLIYRSYLADRRISPDRIPPEVAHIPEIYKESVFHQVRAARDFDLRQYDFSGVKRVHLMVASEEDKPAYRDQLRAWERWDLTSRASLVHLEGAGHAIPDAAPALAAQLTLRQIAGEKDFSDERIYRAENGKLRACADLEALRDNRCE